MNKKRLISHYKNGQSLFTENKAQMISKEMKKFPTSLIKEKYNGKLSIPTCQNGTDEKNK